MTTRAPGLTAAMRRGLVDRSTANCATLQRLYDRELIDDLSRMSGTTPRGQAALAAPRMTAAEYLCLQFYDGAEGLEDHGLKAFLSCGKKVWIDMSGPRSNLTGAGLTALNNMRAAMGSAEYKETV